MFQRPRSDLRLDGIVEIDFERAFDAAGLFQLYDCPSEIFCHPVADRLRRALRDHQR